MRCSTPSVRPSKKSGYEGDYLCVYPIKVNQQRRVIETISQSYSDKPRQAGSGLQARVAGRAVPSS
jgi:arginine decarboxylase-like protein